MVPLLSIIIINYNTRELLKNCLYSIYQSHSHYEIEIIVVDNASIDGSVAMCYQNFPQVIIISNDINIGFGAANNQGISQSKADIILLLNSDTIVPSKSIDKLMTVLLKDSSIGLIGCRLLNEDKTIQQSCMKFPSLGLIAIQELMLYKLSSKIPRLFMEPPWQESVTECDWVFGAAMILRKKAVREVGLFDHKIWMYSEEMELCYRLKKSGWRILFDPTTEIIHLGEGSWKEESYSTTLLKMIGLLYFFKKHHPLTAYYIIKILVLCGAMLRITIWFVWTQLHCFKKDDTHRGFLEIKAHMLFLKKLLFYKLDA